MVPKIYSEYGSQRAIIYANDDAYDFLQTIPDKSIHLIITSPPYNIGKKYETKESFEKYLDAQIRIIEQLVRVLADDGSICWQVGNCINNGEVFPLDIYYYPIFKKLNMQLRNRIVWHFGHGLHAKYRFSGRYETILWFTKTTDNYKFNLDPVRILSKYPGKRYFKGEKKGQISGNPLGKNPSDFWEFLQNEWESEIWDIPNVKANHPEKTSHPCQYPIALVERCVLALTDEGDTVLDPFAGVGSTLLAGLLHNRKVIGIDKDTEYVEIGKDRIKDYYNGSLKIRPMQKPVYVPTGNETVAQIPEEWFHQEK